jgi:hypothetical protein
MTTEPEVRAVTTAEQDPLLWPEEVAALVGELDGEPIEARSVIFYASRSRRRADAGQLTDYDLPVPKPEHYAKRKVTTTGGATRTVKSPRWPRSAIVAWRQAVAARPAPERDRNAAGKYVGAVPDGQ